MPRKKKLRIGQKRKYDHQRRKGLVTDPVPVFAEMPKRKRPNYGVRSKYQSGYNVCKVPADRNKENDSIPKNTRDTTDLDLDDPNFHCSEGGFIIEVNIDEAEDETQNDDLAEIHLVDNGNDSIHKDIQNTSSQNLNGTTFHCSEGGFLKEIIKEESEVEIQVSGFVDKHSELIHKDSTPEDKSYSSSHNPYHHDEMIHCSNEGFHIETIKEEAEDEFDDFIHSESVDNKNLSIPEDISNPSRQNFSDTTIPCPEGRFPIETIKEEIVAETQDSDFVKIHPVKTHPAYNVSLYRQLRSDLLDLPAPFIQCPTAKGIEILSVQSLEERIYVGMRICIAISGEVEIYVHGKSVDKSSVIWEIAPKYVHNKAELLKLLNILSSFRVCQGNPDKELVSLVAIGESLFQNPREPIVAYREENFSAFTDDITYNSTIRSSKCELLVHHGACSSCHKYRTSLKQRYKRREQLLQKNIDFTKSSYKHKDMPRAVLLKKIEQQRQQIAGLQAIIGKLERRLDSRNEADHVFIKEIRDHDYSVI